MLSLSKATKPFIFAHHQNTSVVIFCHSDFLISPILRWLRLGGRILGVSNESTREDDTSGATLSGGRTKRLSRIGWRWCEVIYQVIRDDILYNYFWTLIFCSTFFTGGEGLFLPFFWLMTFDDFLNLCFFKHISYQVLEDEKHLSIEQWTSLNIIEQHWIYFLRVPWSVYNKTRVKAVEVSREAELETQDVQLEMKEAKGLGIYRSLPTKASR